MSTLLLMLCVVAAAVWLAKTLAQPHQTGPSRDSVDDFSRAMHSIAPSHRTQVRAPRPSARPRQTQRPPTRHQLTRR